MQPGFSDSRRDPKSKFLSFIITRLGGFSETEHLVCRAAEPHHPAWLSIFGSANARSKARGREHLDDHLELLRCHYNFVRPHRALKFGRKSGHRPCRLGLTNRSLTLREIFSSRTFLRFPKNVIFVLFASARPVTSPLEDWLWWPSNN